MPNHLCCGLPEGECVCDVQVIEVPKPDEDGNED